MSHLQSVVRKYKQADAALDKNEPKKAERLLRQLVSAEPNEPLFRWKLGYALSEMHQYGKAVREFQEALKVDPQNVAALGCLGKAYMGLGRWKDAEIFIRKRLEHKKSPQYYVFLAHILMQTDRFEEAITACREALSLDSMFAEAYLNMGLSYRYQRSFGEAIDAFKKAVIFNSKYSVAYRELGLTYFSQGKFVAAQTALETSLELDEHDAWSHLYMAMCLQHLNDDKNACSHYSEAARLAPDVEFVQEKRREFLEGAYTPKKNTNVHTLAINEDQNFVALDGFVDDLLKPKDSKRIQAKRSISWIIRQNHADDTVKFKLSYYGPTDIKFGARESFVRDAGYSTTEIGDKTFKASNVVFVGSTVSNDETGYRYIKRVVKKLL